VLGLGIAIAIVEVTDNIFASVDFSIIHPNIMVESPQIQGVLLLLQIKEPIFKSDLCRV
jgi:hypothetical protein